MPFQAGSKVEHRVGLFIASGSWNYTQCLSPKVGRCREELFFDVSINGRKTVIVGTPLYAVSGTKDCRCFNLPRR